MRSPPAVGCSPPSFSGRPLIQPFLESVRAKRPSFWWTSSVSLLAFSEYSFSPVIFANPGFYRKGVGPEVTVEGFGLIAIQAGAFGKIGHQVSGSGELFGLFSLHGQGLGLFFCQ